MSKKRELFKRWQDYVIVLFVIGLISLVTFCEDANAAEIDEGWSLEYYHDSNAGSTDFNNGLDRIGGRYTFEQGVSFYLAPLVAVGGGIGGGFEAGIGDYIGRRWEGQLQLALYKGDMDGGFTLRRAFGDGPFKMTFGGTYWLNESPGSNSDFTFNLGMRYGF